MESASRARSAYRASGSPLEGYFHRGFRSVIAAQHYAQGPVFLRAPQGITNLAGTFIKLSAQAAGTPPLRFQWLKNEELVAVRREGTYLRYTANTKALEDLLGFLYAECCTRNKAVQADKIIQLCK